VHDDVRQLHLFARLDRDACSGEVHELADLDVVLLSIGLDRDGCLLDAQELAEQRPQRGRRPTECA
jgi:hypothetical protein